MELNIHSPLPKRKDFRIGVLGSGFIVNDCHLVAYRKAGFNPVAIASRTPEHAAKVAEQHDISKVYETYEQLLDDRSIEVLDIAVPPNAQLGLIKAACARGTVKGILAQKPLGMNYAEAREAVEACEAAGITLAVNQNMRYDQSVRAAKTLLENGTIGEPVFATIEMRGIPHWMPWQAELGWVTLRIMSIHHLDCFRYWFGDPEGIYCSVRTDPRTKFTHTDGICTYILEYVGGLRCVGIDDTWTGPAKEGCPGEIYIRWRIEGLNGLAIGDIGWCKDPYTSPSSIRFAKRSDSEFQRPEWSESWFPDAFIGTMAQLLIALEAQSQPAISGRDNLKTMALVDAAYLSAARFQSVSIAGVSDHNRRQRPTDEPSYVSPERLELAKWLSENHAKQKPAQNQENLTDLTPRAQQVLSLARKEAAGLNHDFVATEHVLLGIVRLGQGAGFNVLHKLGITSERLEKELSKYLEPRAVRPSPRVDRIPFTPRVKKILSFASKEAKTMNHKYVGTEHLFLGLLRERDGVAGSILRDLGVDAGSARREVLKELDPSYSEPSGHSETTPPTAKTEDQQEGMLSGHSHQVLALAHREAEWFGSSSVGSEHLLLGLLRFKQQAPHSILAKVMRDPGLNLDELRDGVEVIIGMGGKAPQQNIPYGAGLRTALRLAREEAKQLGQACIEPEHLLLGLIAEPDGHAGSLLRNLGVQLPTTRSKVCEITRESKEQK